MQHTTGDIIIVAVANSVIPYFIFEKTEEGYISTQAGLNGEPLVHKVLPAYVERRLKWAERNGGVIWNH